MLAAPFSNDVEMPLLPLWLLSRAPQPLQIDDTIPRFRSPPSAFSQDYAPFRYAALFDDAKIALMIERR